MPTIILAILVYLAQLQNIFLYIFTNCMFSNLLRTPKLKKLLHNYFF